MVMTSLSTATSDPSPAGTIWTALEQSLHVALRGPDRDRSMVEVYVLVGLVGERFLVPLWRVFGGVFLWIHISGLFRGRLVERQALL